MVYIFGQKENLRKAIEFLPSLKGRNLFMPGDPRYQPGELKPFLGYDNWAAWLILVEWFWMVALAAIGEMPASDARLLTRERLFLLLKKITTTMMDEKEKETKHDILALLELMRLYLPTRLHRYLHLGATSYDIICTAYALQAKYTYQKVFWPQICKVDEIWRGKIEETCEILQEGRTHLQTALPITAGFWLATGHNRFFKTAKMALDRSGEIVGKFSGATGTFSAQKMLFRSLKGEEIIMNILDLPTSVSTQITPPETLARFYFELLLHSGSMANLGEDTRILQGSMCREVTSASSSSSAMAHKEANPIAAENVAGMHISVIAEFSKVMMTLVSDLQRDLRWSNVMRSYPAVMVFTFQQLKTAERLLTSLKVNEKRCLENYQQDSRLLPAENLHLFLQKEGFPASHVFVNKVIVPAARASGLNLYDEVILSKNPLAKRILAKAPDELVRNLMGSDPCLGEAIQIAEAELHNKLETLTV